MLVTGPQSLVGVDPLDQEAVRSALLLLADRHKVAIEQSDTLSEEGWITIRIHAFDETSRDAALGDLDALSSRNAAEGGTPVAAGDVDGPARDAVIAHEEAGEAGGPVDALREAYARQRDAPQHEDASAIVVPPAGERRHPRWTCEGCEDCADEVPPGRDAPRGGA